MRGVRAHVHPGEKDFLPVEWKLDLHILLRAERKSKELLFWLDRSPTLAIVLLVLMLVALDGYHLWHSRDVAATFRGMSWDIAESLWKGDGYSFIAPSYFPFSGPTNKVSAAREPVPVLLFAALGTLTGGSHIALGVFHIGVSVLVMLGTFVLARELAGSLVALLSALLWAVYLPAMREVPGKEVDLIAAVFMVWGLVFFVRALRRGDARCWISSGLSLGLAALSRSALAAVILALAGFLSFFPPFSHGRKTGWLRVRPIVLFVVAAALVQLPWMVRNFSVFGRPVIGTTLFGYNFYRQNHLLEEHKYIPFVAGPGTERALWQVISSRPDLKGTENEAEFDLVLREESLRIIRAHPAEYVLLSGYRFLPLWFNWGVPQAYGMSPNITDYFMMIQQGVVLLLALVVGWRALRDEAWPLLVSVGAFTLIHMAVAARMLYTIDVVPILLPLASFGVVNAGTRYRWASVILPTIGFLWVLYAVVVAYGKLPLPTP